MLSWTIGAVTITRVVELEIPIAWEPDRPFLSGASPEELERIAWLFPDFVAPDGELLFSVHALLIDAPGLKLVVDTCLGNDRPRGFLHQTALATPFLEHCDAAGFGREAVDAVLCTHLHVDHVGWNTMREGEQWVPTFPRARYLFNRQEYDHWRHGDGGEVPDLLGDSIQPVLDAGLGRFVEPDHRLSSEICLLPTPGHTPGHVSVWIESQGACAVITGDVLHHPCQLARPEWSAASDLDKAMAVATRKKALAAWADRPLLVIGTHFATPTAGHIVRDGKTWRLRS